MLKALGASLLLLILVACNNNRYILPVKRSGGSGRYHINIDSIRIPLPPHTLHQYFTFSVTAIDGEDFFIGYNAADVQLDIFNLSRQTFVRRIALTAHHSFTDLDKKDQDKSRSVTDVLMINFDSIFINLGNKRLLLIDTAFNRKLDIELSSFRGHEKGRSYGMPISYSHSFKMTWYASQHSLLMHQVFNDRAQPARRPAFVLLNLVDTSIKSLPLYYSDIFYERKGNMGMLGQINVGEQQQQGHLTYNFAYESNIYQYNERTQYVTVYGGKSSLSRNIVQPMGEITEDAEWRIHFIENPQFFPVLYDAQRHLYYRLHLREINYENGKYFHSVLDKALILMVFNEAFELVNETMLPANTYASYSWFVTSKGLYISPTHRKNENDDASALRFNILNIQL